jgi:hypothetical protein
MDTSRAREPVTANRHKGGQMASFAMDEFKSALIVAYEDALLNGISPSSALAATLDWASSELERSMEVPISA